jgi:hypothetical protein
MQPNSTTVINLNNAQIEAIDRASVRFAFTAEERQAFLVQILGAEYEERELIICAADPQYFVVTYCRIYDAQAADWIEFELWKEQIDALNMLHEKQQVIALKARQLGLTWLAIAYALWMMLFRPIASILIFSKRDDEAVYLMSEERLRGMYYNLPKWMRAYATPDDSAHMLSLSNGSNCRAFPTTAGDSYTASYVVIDEADLVPDQNRLMRSVKPTIDAGGKLLLISRADKKRPETEFKKIYKAAKENKNGWGHIFLPWHIRPQRNQAWYEAQKKEIFERTGAYDDLYEQYPATDAEALAPLSKDKRIPALWMLQCYQEERPLPLPEKAPGIAGLEVYRPPEKRLNYRIGGDPAEGNPTSDDSAATVMCVETGEEAAVLAGKYDPAVFAAHIDKIGAYYNDAPVLIERNNHGHAVLLWLKDNSDLDILDGHDGKGGWLSNSKGKSLMYDATTDAFRESSTTLHSERTFDQLSSIEGATLRAPEGQMDDRADSYALAIVGCAIKAKRNSSRRLKHGLWSRR